MRTSQNYSKKNRTNLKIKTHREGTAGLRKCRRIQGRKVPASAPVPVPHPVRLQDHNVRRKFPLLSGLTSINQLRFTDTVRHHSIALYLALPPTQWMPPSMQRIKTYFQPSNCVNYGQNIPAPSDFRYLSYTQTSTSVRNPVPSFPNLILSTKYPLSRPAAPA